MSGQDTDFDPVGLSFTDVLTCVFGAAIVLFLIFIALVVLDGTTGSIQGQSVGYSSKKMKSIQDEVIHGFASATLRIVAEGAESKEVIDLLIMTQFDDLAVSPEPNRQPLFEKQVFFSNEVAGTIYHGIILSGKLRNTNQRIAVPGSDPILNSPIRVSATIIVGGIAKTVKINLSNSAVQKNGTTLFTYGPKVDQFIRSSF